MKRSNILAGIDFGYRNEYVTESKLLLEHKRIYNLWESAGRKIVEAQLTADQINQLFANIEQGATAAGGNRTLIGKGKDAATAAYDAWKGIKDKVYNSGPMKNFAAAYDAQAEKLKQATGGDQGLFKYVQKYRDFAEKNPIIQGFIYTALLGAVGLSGAGAGAAAGVALFKLVDQLIQGKDIRSAIYSAAKTGALAYGAGKLGDYISDKLGGSASDAVDAAQTSGDVAKVGKAVKAAKTFKPKMEYVNGELVDITQTPGFKKIIAQYGEKGYDLALKLGAHQARGGTISEATIALIFTRIDEGLWDTIKGKAAQVGKNLTTKITADKLMKMWKAEGSPNDSKQLAFFLTQKAGVDKGIVDKVFAQMKISTADKKQQAMKRAPGNFAKPAGTKQAGPKQPKSAAPAPVAKPASNAPVAGTRQQGGTFAAKSLYKEDNAEFKQKISNIIKQNPKGSAAEKIILNRFMSTPMGQDLSGQDWIDQCAVWLETNKQKIEKQFPELDLSNVEDLAAKMYEDYLAHLGQLEEASKAEIRANLDQDIKDFLNKGGEIEKLKPNKVRAIPGMGLASKHIGTAGEINRKTRSKMLVGKGRNIQGNKPVVNVEGYSAGASGGAGLGEKINTPGGMGQSYRKHGSGPSGLRKKKNETAIPMFTPEDKMVNANDPGSDGWRVYSAKPSGILEGIVKEYDERDVELVLARVPKGLKIEDFYHKAFKEWLLNKYYGHVKKAWDGVWPFFAQEYRKKHNMKEYKQYKHPSNAPLKPKKDYQFLLGDTDLFDNMLAAMPKGLDATGIYNQGFKEFVYAKFGSKEWPNWKNIRHVYWDAYEKAGHNKPQGFFNKLKAKVGLDENLLNTYGDQLGLDEDVYSDSLYKEFLDSDYNKNQGSYIETLRNLGQFMRSKDMPEEKVKPLIRKLIAKLHPSGINEEQMQLAELKCWAGYTRVRGVPAGAPGSCKKKTKESSIMKGLQAEEKVDEYKEVDSQRKIEFNKENPPDLYYLYQQFIQRMLNPENTIDPNEWIDKVNKHYGLNYTWKDYQKRGHNDHTNNWQKIVDKYILKK